MNDPKVTFYASARGYELHLNSNYIILAFVFRSS